MELGREGSPGEKVQDKREEEQMPRGDGHSAQQGGQRWARCPQGTAEAQGQRRLQQMRGGGVDRSQVCITALMASPIGGPAGW